MIIEPMDFEELRRLEEITIVGGIVEVIRPNKIIRAVITGIMYWPKGHPEQINYEDVREWISMDRQWLAEKEETFGVAFASSWAKRFTGPFVEDTGAIWFASPAQQFVTIYPRDCERPHMPRKRESYVLPVRRTVR